LNRFPQSRSDAPGDFAGLIDFLGKIVFRVLR